MIASGCERVSFEAGRPWRWWVQIVSVLPATPPGSPRPLPEGEFLFGRGGRATSEAECRGEISAALHIAKTEIEEMIRFRPTHALGPDGELIPLTPATPELEA